MKRNYNGCKYSTYGELECPDCVPKTHGPTQDSLDRIEGFTCGKSDWATECQKNNAELDRLSNAFQETATQWQKVNANATEVKPLVLYNAQGRIIQ